MGAEYYRADEAATKAWDAGEMTGATSVGVEAFLATADKWILKTNSAIAGRQAWISSIGQGKDFPCKPLESPLPGALVVYARERIGTMTNELRQLEIRDEHGCPYTVMRFDDSSGLTRYHCPAFPRADNAWRLVGVDASGVELFDYTITNLVKVSARDLKPVGTLPLELGVGPVQLRITNIFRQNVEAWEAGLDGKIFANGSTNTNWIMLDTRFLDRHGNAMSPTNFCREEKFVRVTGKALIRQELRGKDPYRVDFDKLSDCYGFEFAVPREVIKAEEF
jgi:hypothetical protein